MSKYVKSGLIATFIFCAATFAVFLGSGTDARETERWVSVDSSELAQIADTARVAEIANLNSRVETIVDGIAILRLTDPQMELLSTAMHENFHKCSGFVEHSSEADAVAWVERFNTASTDAPQVVYSINNTAVVNSLMNAASEAQNKQVIVDLAAFPNRRYNLQTGVDSANWIKNKWTQLAAGRSDVTVEFFTHPTSTSLQPSIIMTIPGSSLPNEIVVVGAHQDSINGGGQNLAAPGADDDASGIACITETIRVLMLRGFRPQRTVQFMAYAAEEIGLRGSAAIATSYRTANKNVVGVVQFDMTNYKGTQGYDMVMITDFTNAAQNQFIRDLMTTYQPTVLVGNTSCGYACSDHASWTNKSYAASCPFEAPIGNDNPQIHTANDTLALSNNNAVQALKFTKLALSYVAELAKGCVSARMPCSTVATADN